jgi:hypothetical protein
MVPARYIVCAVLAAGSAAAGIAGFFAPAHQVTHYQGSPLSRLDSADHGAPPLVVHKDRAYGEEEAAAEYLEAARAILRRAPTAQASLAGADPVPIKGPIPLPKRRPLPRP